jgi:hypothetical protein
MHAQAVSNAAVKTDFAGLALSHGPGRQADSHLAAIGSPRRKAGRPCLPRAAGRTAFTGSCAACSGVSNSSPMAGGRLPVSSPRANSSDLHWKAATSAPRRPSPMSRFAATARRFGLAVHNPGLCCFAGRIIERSID